MSKRFFSIIFAMSMMAVAPITINAGSSIEIIEQNLQSIDISVTGSILHVTGAAGENLYVYNVTGVRVKSIRIDSNDKRYDLNLPKGCYIVKVGKVVRKISIR